MAKSNKSWLWLVLLVGAAFALSNSEIRGNLFSAVGIGDDYAFYDDFSVPSSDLTGLTSIDTRTALPSNFSTWQVSFSAEYNIYKPYGSGSVSYSSGNLLLGAGGFSSKLALTSVRDFRGGDVKVVFEGATNYGSESHPGTGCGVVVGGFSATNCDYGRKHVLEVKSSLNGSVIEATLDGTSLGQRTLAEGEPLLVKLFVNGGSCPPQASYACSSTQIMKVYEVKFKVPFSCEYGAGEFLAYESFTGGRELGLYSFRHGVVKFCLAHPVIINEAGSGTDTSAEPYQTWAKGGTVSIPENQNWLVFYVMRNDGSISLVCSGGEAFNAQTNTCTNVTGLIGICSEGSFDPGTGECVTYPEIRPVCPSGRYDVALDACVWNPPLQAVCENPEAVYIPSTGKCELSAPTDHVCVDGTYNPARNVCEAFPLKVVVCSDPLAAYDASLDKCVREVESSIGCDGTYYPDSGKCVETLPAQPQCSKGTLYQKSGGAYVCTYEPETENFCTQGSYDSGLDACVVVPDLTYLCTKGEYNGSLNSCVITVEGASGWEMVKKSWLSTIFGTENASTTTILVVVVAVLGVLAYFRMKKK